MSVHFSWIDNEGENRNFNVSFTFLLKPNDSRSDMRRRK